MTNHPTYPINLPKTNFPMRADLAKREPIFLQLWQEIHLYKKIQQKDSPLGKFVLHDGPPYANGEIHLGHAVNKIIKDIVNKSKLLDGYSIEYIPGWDCHGLPTELNVEKKIGHVGDKLTADKFIGECRKYATEQVALQRAAFIRLGLVADWDNYYQTMAPIYEANIIRALGEVIANGYVERGFKPVHWCVACGSALAEAEVEYIDKTSYAIDVCFPVIDASFFNLGDVTINVPIWTTTPWTLPANEAVTLHPDFAYALVKCQNFNGNDDEYLLIAKDLLTNTMDRYGIENEEIIAIYYGKELQGLLLSHPFLPEKNVPIILGEHVTTDTGTGAVHTAPAHGADDFIVGKKYNLPIKNPVGSDGRFSPDTLFFAGEKVLTVDEHVLEVLRAQGALIHAEKIQHSYPHCWRHKIPLIFRATEQWFISMDKKVADGKSLREKALQTIAQCSDNFIAFAPDEGRKRIETMITNRPDWCISRQRFWGTPMPLFLHKITGELHPETQRLIEFIAQQVAKEGIEYWRRLNTEEFLRENAKDYPASDYEKSTDTLDVWFDSGTSHFCVLNSEMKFTESEFQYADRRSTNPAWKDLHFPADLYLEGSDQYRGWFQSSLLTSIAISGKAPYKAVLTHGFTVDANGRKMSKSLGNVIAPSKVINTLGADVLRLWVASSNTENDITVSDEILQRSVDTYRNIRNTARFLLSNLYDFSPKKDLVTEEEMLMLDRFAVQEVAKNLSDSLRSFYTKHSFNAAVGVINAIPIGVNTLSNFYFSIIKDRLYTMQENSLGRRSAQTALYHILEMFIRSIAPITSFTAEEIWQTMRKMWTQNSQEQNLQEVNFDNSIRIRQQDKFTGSESILKTSKQKNFDISNDQERKESIFLTNWYDLKIDSQPNDLSYDNWVEIQGYCSLILKKLEETRSAIPSNLEAEITLYCSDTIYSLLSRFSDKNSESELKFLLIVSKVDLKKIEEKSIFALPTDNENLFLEIKRTKHKKCSRCWHRHISTGTNSEHPELCDRCVTNIAEGNGEYRKFV